MHDSPCAICDAPATGAYENTTVSSNVRAFRHERFAVWRCPACRSIHAGDAVDLGRYYDDYPLQRRNLDWIATLTFDRLRFRLQRAGLRRRHRILDYGCGHGLFVHYLRRKGYTVAGYDPYDREFSSTSVLDDQYDAILLQDVVEHVADPRELLRDADGLLRPGGLVAIGTPNADAIDLSRAHVHVHTLHQPYHRHILSAEALLAMGRGRGWQLARYYPRHYGNTRLPFLNFRFFRHYAECFDNTMDLVAEPVRLNRRVLSPRGIALGLAGFWLSPEDDVMAIFHKRCPQ